MRDVVAFETGVVVISAVVVDSMVAIVKMVVEVPMGAMVVMVVTLSTPIISLHLESSCQCSSHQADVEEEDWKTNAGNANLEVR